MPSTLSRPRQRRRDLDDDDDEIFSQDSVSTSSRDSLSGSHISSSSSTDGGIAAKLPTLPDLRFEQSYLATIRRFLHEDRAAAAGDGSSSNEKQSNEEDHHHKIEVTHSNAKDEHELWLGNLRVEWFPILYVTVRDQLLSPLIQGAVWGLGGLLLSQFRQYMSMTVKQARESRATPTKSYSSTILRSLGLTKR